MRACGCRRAGGCPGWVLHASGWHVGLGSLAWSAVGLCTLSCVWGMQLDLCMQRCLCDFHGSEVLLLPVCVVMRGSTDPSSLSLLCPPCPCMPADDFPMHAVASFVASGNEERVPTLTERICRGIVTTLSRAVAGSMLHGCIWAPRGPVSFAITGATTVGLRWLNAGHCPPRPHVDEEAFSSCHSCCYLHLAAQSVASVASRAAACLAVAHPPQSPEWKH